MSEKQLTAGEKNKLKLGFLNPNKFEEYKEGKYFAKDICFFSKQLEYMYVNSSYTFKADERGLILGLGNRSADAKNVIIWNVEEFFNVYYAFKANTLAPYTFAGRNFVKGEEAILTIDPNKYGYEIGVQNGSTAYAMNFSVKAFSIILDKIYEHYFNFILAEYTNKGVLQPKDLEIATTYKLKYDSFIKLGQWPHQAPYKENKPLFSTANEDGSTISLLMNSFNAADGFKMFKINYEKDGFVRSLYLPWGEALVLHQDILSGKVFRAYRADRSVTVYSYQGGTGAEKSKREDKQPEARIFSISTTTKPNELELKLEFGLGKTTDKTRGILMDRVEETYTAKIALKQALSLANIIYKSIYAYLVQEFPKDVKKDCLEQKLAHIDKANSAKALVNPTCKAMNMGKIRFDFLEYNTDTHKQVKYVDFYMEESIFDDFYYDIFHGTLAKETLMEWKKMQTTPLKKGEFPKPTRNFSAGEHLDKMFNFIPSTVASTEFSLQGISRVYEDNGTGKFVFKKGSQVTVSVGMTAHKFKQMLLLINVYFKAFKTAQFIYLHRMQMLWDAKQETNKQVA